MLSTSSSQITVCPELSCDSAPASRVGKVSHPLACAHILLDSFKIIILILERINTPLLYHRKESVVLYFAKELHHRPEPTGWSLGKALENVLALCIDGDLLDDDA